AVDAAGFNANQAWSQLLEECQHIAPLQLAANSHAASSINAVDLKNRLRDVETNCLDRLHVRLLRIVRASPAPTPMTLTCRWRSRPQHQKRTFVSPYRRAIAAAAITAIFTVRDPPNRKSTQ